MVQRAYRCRATGNGFADAQSSYSLMTRHGLDGCMMLRSSVCLVSYAIIGSTEHYALNSLAADVVSQSQWE